MLRAYEARPDRGQCGEAAQSRLVDKRFEFHFPPEDPTHAHLRTPTLRSPLRVPRFFPVTLVDSFPSAFGARCRDPASGGTVSA
jgi:hypothetical protein